jgi:hypothetical protein
MQWPMLESFFQRNYVTIGVTSVKIIGKYAASGVNYAQKSFIILVTSLHSKSKLQALPTNIRLGWKCLSVTRELINTGQKDL